MSDQILIDKPTAARMLSVSVRLLEKLMRRGELTPVRVGDRVLFTRESLDRFVQEQCRRTGRDLTESLSVRAVN